MIKKLNGKMKQIQQKQSSDTSNELHQTGHEQEDNTLAAGMIQSIDIYILKSANGVHHCFTQHNDGLSSNSKLIKISILSHEFVYDNLTDFYEEDIQDFTIGSGTDG